MPSRIQPALWIKSHFHFLHQSVFCVGQAKSRDLPTNFERRSFDNRSISSPANPESRQGSKPLISTIPFAAWAIQPSAEILDYFMHLCWKSDRRAPAPAPASRTVPQPLPDRRFLISFKDFPVCRRKILQLPVDRLGMLAKPHPYFVLAVRSTPARPVEQRLSADRRNYMPSPQPQSQARDSRCRSWKFARSFKLISAMIVSVPSEPVYSLARSYPVTFFTTRPPVFETVRRMNHLHSDDPVANPAGRSQGPCALAAAMPPIVRRGRSRDRAEETGCSPESVLELTQRHARLHVNRQVRGVVRGDS